MRHVRGFAAVICVWALCVAAAGGLLARAQAQERESLMDRFQSRSDTGASFVGAYVADVFQTESRLAAKVTEEGWRPEAFVPDLEFLGFSAGLLLDAQGRAVVLAPAAPAMHGTQFASRYPHLAGALAGTATVSDVIASAVEKEPIVAFALPLDSGRAGVLSGGFSLADSPLRTFLERQPIRGTRGWVLDSHGAVIVAAGPGIASAPPPDVRSRADRTPAVARGRVVARAPIAATGWTYVLDAPRDALLAPVAPNDAGEWVFLATFATLGLVGLVVLRRATAARTRARVETARADHRLRLTVQNAPIGMTMVDLEYRFVEPNGRLCHMLGYSAEDLVTMTFAQVTHPNDLELDLDHVAQLFSGEIDTYMLEKRYLRSDGSVMWGRLSVSLVRDERDVPLYFVSQIEDVTEFRAARSELEFRALYDPLTGLANRSLLMDRLAAELTGGREPASVGLGFCDVDHFKAINDTHGHHAGDEVLKEVARRLRRAVRAGDTVARLGGDEFVILLPDVGSSSEAELVLERAASAVKEPMHVDGLTLLVTMSGGLALGGTGTEPGALLRDADMALYAAKEGGRGRIMVVSAAVADPSTRTEVRRAGAASAQNEHPGKVSSRG